MRDETEPTQKLRSRLKGPISQIRSNPADDVRWDSEMFKFGQPNVIGAST